MPTTSAESVPWERFVYPRKSAKKTVAGIISCFFLLTLVNMVSQMLHRFGFIRLGSAVNSITSCSPSPRPRVAHVTFAHAICGCTRPPRPQSVPENSGTVTLHLRFEDHVSGVRPNSTKFDGER